MKKRMRVETTNDCSGSMAPSDTAAIAHQTKKASEGTTLLFMDQGHRYGNFHNYYNFNPPSNRTSCMQKIIEFVITDWRRKVDLSSKANNFRYMDVGCNEGDLTLEVSKLLSKKLALTQSCTGVDKNDLSDNRPTIKVYGLDLDSELIQRAHAKFQRQVNLHLTIQAEFRVADVLKDGIPCINYPLSSASDSSYCSDMTSLFSTTMWLHIHGGDEGLQRVLKQICSCTRYWILIESQPSKCYANAAFRLRRLGLEPVNVSNERLKLRSNIEKAIELILKKNQFERIDVETKCPFQDCNPSDETNQEARTSWKRSVRLYGRMTCSNSNSYS